MNRKRNIFLLCMTLFMAGCGYTSSSLLPEHLKTVYIQPFRNKIELTAQLAPDQDRFRTYSPNLETDILEIHHLIER